MSLLVALLAAPAASAQETGDAALRDALTVSGSVEAKVRYYMAPNGAVLPGFEDQVRLYDYGETVSRTNLLLTHERFQLGAQVDHVALFNSWYYLDDERTLEFQLLGPQMNSPWDMGYATPEKLYFSVFAGPATVTVGDSYVNFGRGLALNLVRNAQIDIDSTVRGAQVVVSPGMWDLQLVSGVVNQVQVQMVNPNRDLRANRNHLVNGARITRHGLGPLTVSAYGVAYSFAETLDDPNWQGGVKRYGEIGAPDAIVGGGGIEGYTGPVDWYVEGNWFQYREDQLLPNGQEPAYAVYGSMSFYPGPLSVLIEGKRYRNTERMNVHTAPERYEIVSGPTLEYERVITEDSSSAVNSNDIYGGLMRVDWAAVPGRVTPYASVLVQRDNDLENHFNRSPETIVHPMLGLDLQGDVVNLWTNVGYRRDIRDRHGADQLFHADAALGVPLPGQWHADANWDIWHFKWGENQNQQHDFTTSTLAVAAHWHPQGLAFIVYNDFTNDPLIDSVGNVADNVYLAGEVQWNVTERTQVKAFYGAYRAGIRCAGGQCRLMPGFDGGRVTVLHTF